MRKLTERRSLFVKSYIETRNATKAAIAAGYSEKTAGQQGSRLLKDVKIQAEIDRANAKIYEKYDVNAERILRELVRVGFINMQDFLEVDDKGSPRVDLSALTDDQACAIQEVTTETFMVGRGDDKREVTQIRFKLADKLRALELMGKHLKMFTDKVEVSGAEVLVGRLQAARKRLTA